VSDRLTRLMEERARAWSNVQDIRARLNAEQRDPNEDEDVAFRGALDDVERLSKQIEDEQRAARLDAVDHSQVVLAGAAPEPATRDEADYERRYNDAFDAYLRKGMSGLLAEQRDMLVNRDAEIRDLRRHRPDRSDPRGEHR